MGSPLVHLNVTRTPKWEVGGWTHWHSYRVLNLARVYVSKDYDNTWKWWIWELEPVQYKWEKSPRYDLTNVIGSKRGFDTIEQAKSSVYAFVRQWLKERKND